MPPADHGQTGPPQPPPPPAPNPKQFAAAPRPSDSWPMGGVASVAPAPHHRRYPSISSHAAYCMCMHGYTLHACMHYAGTPPDLDGTVVLPGLEGAYCDTAMARSASDASCDCCTSCAPGPSAWKKPFFVATSASASQL